MTVTVVLALLGIALIEYLCWREARAQKRRHKEWNL